jgi:hypothetical protein
MNEHPSIKDAKSQSGKKTTSKGSFPGKFTAPASSLFCVFFAFINLAHLPFPEAFQIKAAAAIFQFGWFS